MSTTLTNGIIIPDNGSRNWGGDLANNWNILDVNVGYMNDVKNSVTTLETSVAENTANIQINTSNISALQTSKQDNLSEQQIANIADVTNKANDADVVHKSGDEFIQGVKNFNDVVLKTLNGINPGALSLPNVAERVEVTSQVITTEGGFKYTNNFYDGWLVVTAYADNVRLTNGGFEVRAVKSINNAITTYVPLRLNDTIQMYFTNFTNFAYVNLYKCVGNA